MRRKSVSCALVALSGLLAPTATWASAVSVEVDGRAVGEGFAAHRQRTCVVVSASHVVPTDYRRLQVLGPAGDRTSAHVLKRDDQLDVVVLSLDAPANSACRSVWKFAAHTDREGDLDDASLRMLDDVGADRQLEVRLDRIPDGTTLQVRAERDGVVEAGMSGSAVVAKNAVVGMLYEGGSALARPIEQIRPIVRFAIPYRFWQDGVFWAGSSATVVLALATWKKERDLNGQIQTLDMLPQNNQAEIEAYNSAFAQAQDTQDKRNQLGVLTIAMASATTGYTLFRVYSDDSRPAKGSTGVHSHAGAKPSIRLTSHASVALNWRF